MRNCIIGLLISFFPIVSIAGNRIAAVDLAKNDSVTLENVGGVLIRENDKRGGHQLILVLDKKITLKGCEYSAKGSAVKQLVVDFKNVSFGKHFYADYLFTCYERYNLVSIGLIQVRDSN